MSACDQAARRSTGGPSHGLVVESRPALSIVRISSRQSAVPVQPLAGKPVLDASYYIPQRDGPILGLYDGPPSSEVLQQHLPTAHVVKVFNNITRATRSDRVSRKAGTQAPRSRAAAASSDT